MTSTKLYSLLVAFSSCVLSASAAPMFTTLATFDGSNGSAPMGTLIADAAGNLYGTTFGGGSAGGFGTIYRLDHATYELTKLTSLNANPSGYHPYSGLLADSAGNFYGTTSRGGRRGGGTVYKYNLETNQLTTLAAFAIGGGASSLDGPYAGLIADAAGNLYGTNYNGGTSARGTVFKVNPLTQEVSTLVTFTQASYESIGVGTHPYGGLLADAAGNLYGTTSFGGNGNPALGTVFKLNPTTSELTTLVTFQGANGSMPKSDLIADASGNLYGTTYRGGPSDKGTVFKLDPVSGALTTLMSFNGANGANPIAGLIADAAGNLYGTTDHGGSSDLGTVFKIEAGTNAITTLASFDGTNGAYPVAGLLADAAGNLFGAAYSGEIGSGSIYKISDTGFVVVPEPGLVSLLLLLACPLLLCRLSRRRAFSQIGPVNVVRVK